MSCEDEAVWLAVAGEIDVASVPQVREALDAGCATDAPTVVLDLGAVTFIDSSGIGALIEIHRRLQAQRRQLTISHLNPSVLKVLQISGAADLLGVTGSASDPAFSPYRPLGRLVG